MSKTRRWVALFAVPMGLLVVFACTERNPRYDPEAYCETGERRCDPSGVVLVCTDANEWPAPDAGDRWVIECWQDTACEEGRCLPDADARLRPCLREGDCDGGRLCSALVSHEDPNTLAGVLCDAAQPRRAGGGAFLQHLVTVYERAVHTQCVL